MYTYANTGALCKLPTELWAYLLTVKMGKITYTRSVTQLQRFMREKFFWLIEVNLLSQFTPKKISQEWN